MCCVHRFIHYIILRSSDMESSKPMEDIPAAKPEEKKVEEKKHERDIYSGTSSAYLFVRL